MRSKQKHWDKIFSKYKDSELGWFENDFTQSMKFIRPLLKGDTTIFIPGAGTSDIIDEIYTDNRTLILNDISLEALNTLKSRTGEKENIHWLHHDMSRPFVEEIPPVDLWIDRAVLHFLRKDKDIDAYFTNLKSLIKKDGHVFLAEFSLNGMTRCTGLKLHRYSIEEMQERLGPGFTLIEHEEYVYESPYGEQKPFLYALFRCDITS